MRGRKRTPSESKQVMGTHRQDRVAPNEAMPMDGEPDLSWRCEPEVVAWFDRFVFYLKGENRASKSHETILWLAARRAAEIEVLDSYIKAIGRVYWKKGRDGEKLVSNPAVAQKNEAERQLQSLLSELGLTPASKSRVSADLAPQAGSDWDGFGSEALN